MYTSNKTHTIPVIWKIYYTSQYRRSFLDLRAVHTVFIMFGSWKRKSVERDTAQAEFKSGLTNDCSLMSYKWVQIPIYCDFSYTSVQKVTLIIFKCCKDSIMFNYPDEPNQTSGNKLHGEWRLEWFVMTHTCLQMV